MVRNSTGNKGQKKAPNNMPSDTKTNGRLFSVFYSIRRDRKLPKDIPQRTLYRLCKILKDKTIIKKTGYATWGIDNVEKAIEFAKNHNLKQYAIKSPFRGVVTPGDFHFTDKRGHRLLLTITTPSLPLEKIKRYLEYKKRGYVQWVSGGNSGRKRHIKCYFGGARFFIYRDHTVVEFNKSFFDEHHIDTQEQAQAHYKAVLDTFEANIGGSIRIGKELLVSASMHFEKVNSDFAKWCFDNGLKIRFTSGDFKYWQDHSGNKDNEEGNKAVLMDDLDKFLSVDMAKKFIDHKQKTGRNWMDDVDRRFDTMSKLLLTKIQMDMPPTPQDIEETKKKHRDLPSYFG